MALTAQQLANLARGREIRDRRKAERLANGNGAAVDGTDGIDPAAVAGTAAEPAERRGKGGRPRAAEPASAPIGTAAKPAATKGTSLDLSAGVGLVQGFYAVLALPGGAHWMMPEAEAKQFVTAWQNVMRHYPITMTQKAFDWAMCFSAMLYLNIPRVTKTVQQRRDKQRGQPRPQATILRFAQPGGAAASPGMGHNGGPPLGAAVTTGPSPAETGIMAEGPPDPSAIGAGAFDGV